MNTPKTTKTASAPETRSVCPNCDQWQDSKKQFAENVPAYWDCFNDCAERGFAPKRYLTASAQPENAREANVWRVRLANGLPLTEKMELQRQLDEAQRQRDELLAGLRDIKRIALPKFITAHITDMQTAVFARRVDDVASAAIAKAEGRK